MASVRTSIIGRPRRLSRHRRAHPVTRTYTLRCEEPGFERGDGSRHNPGFYRDGDTRFEASLRIDTARATGPDAVALLGHALDYLTEA